MNNKTILVVDDEPDIRELISYNLTREGYRVIAFPDPVLSLTYLEHNSPDIILSDWLMPGMDGLEFCRRLKMNGKMQNITIIMISCRSDEDEINSALNLGINHYMVKPFIINDLTNKIKSIIDIENYK